MCSTVGNANIRLKLWIVTKSIAAIPTEISRTSQEIRVVEGRHRLERSSIEATGSARTSDSRCTRSLSASARRASSRHSAGTPKRLLGSEIV